MAPKNLVITREGPIALLCLNRPSSGNLINSSMAWELREACRCLNQDEDLRVAVITGCGQTFSQGREIFSNTSASSKGPALAQWLEEHRVASTVAGLRMPSIALINGDAIDHGLELSLACDLRVAAQGARLGFTDLSQGLIPWDGGTQRLPRVIGRARALELLLTGRLVDSDEALNMGLVNAVIAPKDLLSRAMDLARGISQGGPIAQKYTKEAVHKGQDLSLHQGLDMEADLSFILQSTRDRAEGLSSFAEKRDPRFKGE